MRRNSIPSARGVYLPTMELFSRVFVTDGGLSQRWMSLPEVRAAVERWVARSYKTADPRAKTHGGEFQCGSCRFVMMLDGDYGLCGNAESPNDGRVVFEHGGCAEHSEKEKWEA